MWNGMWTTIDDDTITVTRDNTNTITRDMLEGVYVNNYVEPEISGISRNREHEICKAFIDNMKDRKKLNSFLKKYNNLASIQESNMDEFVWLYVTEGCKDEFNELNKRNILIDVNKYLLKYIL